VRSFLAHVGPLLVVALCATHVHATAPRPAPRRALTPPRHVTTFDGVKKHGAGRDPMAPYAVAYRHTLFHIHTRELLPVARVPDELARAHFLRCRLTGDEHAMATEPFHVALALADALGSERIEVVSGYRSPKLNESLRKKGHQVASESQHTHGTALDFRLPGTPAIRVAAAASAIHVGGIGTYTESDFVHVDTGRDRRWSGR